MTTTHHTYSVMDTDVAVPMTVEHAVAGLTVLAGDADAIDRSLPDDLAPVRLPGGFGVVLLLAVDYVDNPLGDYDEVVVGLAARPVGMRGGPLEGVLDVLRGRFGVWIEHMAVDQAFTREAGETIWGFPKTLDELAFDHGGRRATCTWARDGQEVLRVTQPTRGLLPAPALPVSTYTRIDGRTMQTRLRARSRGVGVAVTGVDIELGEHPLSEELAELGLARRPLAAAWLSSVRMRFSAATPLHRTTP